MTIVHYETPEALRLLTAAHTSAQLEDFMRTLPLDVGDASIFDPTDPSATWSPGKLHWVPVGMARGNAGRIKLASQGENPLAERLINGMEAQIELARQRESLADPNAPSPSSPREAVQRYFNLSRLDLITHERGAAEWKRARALASNLRLRVSRFKVNKTERFTVVVEDDGIGQAPDRVHKTLLSLSESNKGDKPYLIGLFGQGGSSAFQASRSYSWLLSRRASDLLEGEEDGVGWSIVRQIFPVGRRDSYYAYLAQDSSGAVPRFSEQVADEVGIRHGTRFAHIDYDFQRSGGSVARNLFPALNHLLFNPIMPFELYMLRDEADVIWGHGYRLTDAMRKLRNARNDDFVDKTFSPQRVLLRESSE